MSKVLVYELNEVPWRVIDFYLKHRPNANLHGFLKSASSLTTHTVDSGELHPWSTWPTMHRGVSNDTHGIRYNTRVIDVVKELHDFGCQVDVTDCWADSAEAEHEYGISLTEKPEQGSYSGVIVAVPHREYAAMSAGDLRGYLRADGVLFDLKGLLPLGEADLRL